MTDDILLVAGVDSSLLPRVAEVTSLQVVGVNRVTGDVDGLDRVVAIAGSVPPAVLPLVPRLRWVHSWAAGPDADLSFELGRHPAVFTSSAGNGAIPLAEHAMMLLMQLNRGERLWAAAQSDKRWERRTHGELAGLTLGLFGLGNAGRDLAAKAESFHMRVIACRRNADRAEDHVSNVYPPSRLAAFLAECDAVVVTAPLTSETRGIFDHAAFRAMKPTAFWICVSRGGIADDSALLTALTEGWIAGAGIDAHAAEPLPAASPFWTAPNTIITPHNGATTTGTARRGVEIFIENVRRFEAGESLKNVVDKEAGY